MKTYLFKNKLNGKFGLPFFINTLEEFKFNYKQYIEALFNEKKKPEIQKLCNFELYEIADYNSDLAKFENIKLEKILDIKEFVKETLDGDNHENN